MTPMPHSKALERRSGFSQKYRGKRRAVIVVIGPGDLIGFRLEGCSRVTRITVASAYWEAVRQEAGMAAPRALRGKLMLKMHGPKRKEAA